MLGIEEKTEIYRNLNHFEQTLLQLLSIIYEPAHTTLVVSCLRKLELTGPRGNRPTTAGINHYLTKFQDLGLVAENRQCSEEIVEFLSREAVLSGQFNDFAQIVQKEAPVSYFYGKWTTRCWRAMRQMRIGIYSQDFSLIDDALVFLDSQCKDLLTPLPPPVQVTTSPFNRSWFRTLPPSFQFFLLTHIFKHSLAQLDRFQPVIDYLTDDQELADLDEDEKLPFLRLLLNHFIIAGELAPARELIATYKDAFTATGSAGTIAYLEGDYPKSLTLFNDDIEKLRQINATRDCAFFGLQGLFHILSIIKSGGESSLQASQQQISIALTLFGGSEEATAYEFLSEVISRQTDYNQSINSITVPEGRPSTALTLLFASLCQYWLDASILPDAESELRNFYQRALDNGYHFYSGAFAEILAKISPHPAPYQATLEETTEKHVFKTLLNTFEPEEPWKRSLQALINISADALQDSPGQDTRLIWLVGYDKQNLHVNPREQKRSADGTWSKGRPVALSRLHGPTKLNYLSLQDRKICLAITKRQTKDSLPQFSLHNEKLLPALVGHPLLFLASSPNTPVEFISGEPELLVEESSEKLHVRFSLPISDENVALIQETPTRFKVIKIDDNHRRIAQITGRDGLTVPIEASEQVLTAIGNISSFMTVHSAIAGDQEAYLSQDITGVEADSTIYMHMLPYGSGFRLEMFVKPFKEGTHYLKPGQGVENIMAEVNGQRLQTRRNLSEEEQKARDIEELCPILDLAIDMEQENDREWHLQEPDDCLQALMELQEISDKVIIEWPEGEKLAVTHKPSFKNLNLKIRTNRQNWFGLSGELVLDQERVIDLKELLARVENSPGRFIQIDNGQFIALTQEFRKKLEEINTYAQDQQVNDQQEIVIHPLAALPLEELSNKAVTSVDNGWQEQLDKIKESQSVTPELPSTLRAELRDYQREGYNWLARLAHWGVGGCLADDMGLGKTLQSLAIILSRAHQGPSLVVAPTSVSTNWFTEVSRFTPTLNIKQLQGKDRAATVESLTKFDLMITTYTLLQQEVEPLSKVQWQTIILDEAQAIKNAATKRSQAAMSLNGAFRIITTGTPIENHLGELWNLFNFINPGLLGSHHQFNEKFAIPIERYNNRDARLKLKKLIRPFILRRIKSQVLEELPPRTEVTLDVAMSPEETHFYEALRQNALEILERAPDGQGRHLQILTEIMKLRQACCNPRLIAEETRIPSSKLEIFSSIITELIASNHKALVFSQFIGHLNIIREYLDNERISYQYLDGSTSSKQRKERVERFQSGEGDLFLISLKAGGLGLNLTAADYVIHMDPWWNPAIEDQASDRAHRIGQTRPVTIYRLVCKNTIEEKIVKLHQEKR
ncbi:MAG: DEAD/DEAH box helicase, partial [Desulfobulbaceae bacterium]